LSGFSISRIKIFNRGFIHLKVRPTHQLKFHFNVNGLQPFTDQAHPARDNEIRSVQAALRRLGIYSGQVDGILGPDTHRAIEDYQVKNKLPVTGQPDQGLNALLGIF